MIEPPGSPTQTKTTPGGHLVAATPTRPKPPPTTTAKPKATTQKAAEADRPAVKKLTGEQPDTASGSGDTGAASTVIQPAEDPAASVEYSTAIEAAAEPAGGPTQPDLEPANTGEQEQVIGDEESTESVTMAGDGLNLSDLPLTFGNYWSLDRSANPVSLKTQCLLTSEPVNISDGYDRTNVRLVLTADTLYITADSNIDLSYPESGIHLDDGKVVILERLAEPTTAVVSNDLGNLYQQLADGRTALVKLGFWPTWPVTETQQARFSLQGFAEARDAMRYCEMM